MQRQIFEDCVFVSCTGSVTATSANGVERMVSPGDILSAGDLVTFEGNLDTAPLVVAAFESNSMGVAFHEIVEVRKSMPAADKRTGTVTADQDVNDEGGHSFVVVDYANTAGRVDLIGIETASIPASSNEMVEEQLVAARGDKDLVAIDYDDTPTAGLVIDAVDEDDVNSASTIVSGTLNIDFGADGVGDITFSSASVPVTSSGNTIHYQLLDNGHQLRGYVDLDGGAYEMDVFIAEIDPATGAYTFQLLAAFDHPDPAFEDEVLLNLVYMVSDSDGDMASGALAMSVIDGVPVVVFDDFSVYEGNQSTGQIDFNAGADGATLTHLNGQDLEFDQDGWSNLIECEFGTLKVKADGTYEYIAQDDDPYISAGQDSFEFTITDGDGDMVSVASTISIEDVTTTTMVSLSATSSTSEDGSSITYTATLSNVANTDVMVTLSNSQTINIYAAGTDLGGGVIADGLTGSLTVPLTIRTDMLFSDGLSYGADKNQILVGTQLLVEDTNISDEIGHLRSGGGVIGIDNNVIEAGETIIYKFGDTIAGSESPNYTVTNNLIVNDVALNLIEIGLGSDTFTWTAYKNGVQVGAGGMTVGVQQNDFTSNLSGIIETGADTKSDGLIHVVGGYDQLNITVASGSLKVGGLSIGYELTGSVSAEITGVSQVNAGTDGTFEELGYDATPVVTTIVEVAPAVVTEPTATGFNATINNSFSETIDILNIDWSTDGPGNVAFGFSGDTITHNGNTISWSQADYNLDGLMDFNAVDDVTLENVFGIDSSVSGYSFTVYSPVDLSAPEQLTISSSGVGTNTYAIGYGDTVVAKNGFTGPTLYAVDTANTDVNISAGGIGIKTISESTSTSFSPGYSIGSGEQIELEFASLTNDLNFITTNPAAKYFWQAKLDGATVASGNETNEITAASGFDSLLIVGNGGSGNRFAISQMEYQDLGTGGSSSVNLDFHAVVTDANGSSVAGDFHIMLDTTSITQLLAATPDNVFA